MPTKIEWTDEVWSPVTGCEKISSGCKNCYAERIAGRFWKDRAFTDVRCHHERLGSPRVWKKPRRIFVNSMSDLFHEAVPSDFIRDCFWTMSRCGWHEFIVLTKRTKRLAEFLEGPAKNPNIVIGVSVENQETADARIPALMASGWMGRTLISYEPALGPVDFRAHFSTHGGVDWLIAGCESGPKARPAETDWFRSARDQCVAALVPFFLKQMTVNGKLEKTPFLDGRQWLEGPAESGGA